MRGTPIDAAAVAARLKGHRSGNGYDVQCPAHVDKTASLSVADKDGRLLVHCKAGCSQEAVVGALKDLDLWPTRKANGFRSRIVATYDYRDEEGAQVFQVVRLQPKDFRQRRRSRGGDDLRRVRDGWFWGTTGTRKVPYRLPELIAGIAAKATVWITEGEKDADRLAGEGLVATTNAAGGTNWAKEHSSHLRGATVVILEDNDDAGRKRTAKVSASLADIAASIKVVRFTELPEHGDVSDWLNRGGTIERLCEVADEAPEAPVAPCEPAKPAYTGPSLDLSQVHAVYRKWLGDLYDTSALDAVLAVAASERMAGDPCWLLVIGGPGVAKTETVQHLDAIGARVISTIASEGALLSGTEKRSQVKNATGGLLRSIGKRGILVIKDVTTILSMNREARAAVLAALREIYDGLWVRNIGSGGGQTLTWNGRIVAIGAVTTAWDQAHDVIGRLGGRFVVVRLNSRKDRLRTTMQALANTGQEAEMRRELQQAVAGLMKGVYIDGDDAYPLSEQEQARLATAADLVTLARSAVDIDARGNIEYAHDPEIGTRFAKQLAMLMRGALAIGMPRLEALNLALRCAGDSMPPMRRLILADVAAHPRSRPVDVRRRTDKPYTTVNRQLESLHFLEVLTCHEEEEEHAGKLRYARFYSLAPDVDPQALDLAPAQEKML